MMRRLTWIGVVCIALAMVIGLVGAQTIEPVTPPDSNRDVAISFPPPVWILSDTAAIIGTADTLNMSDYVIEYRELNLNPAEENNGGFEFWFPATLPRNLAVRNGELGVWNTTTVRDGLYSLRLVVNTSDGQQETFIVSPVRVENDPEDGIALPAARATLQPTPTNLPGGRGPLPATPTPLVSRQGDPLVTARVDANVRRGDDTSYPVAGFLLEGQQARIIGTSSSGSGWYYVELENGRRGFIAPSVVDVSGDTSNLSLINPPATPTPQPTATPVTRANLQITGLRLDPPQPRCGEGFDIYVNVNNSGSGATARSGVLTITDRHVASGSVGGQTVGGFPVINAGENFVVVSALTVSVYYEEEHEIVVRLDSNNEIPETNESDNTAVLRYTLDQGTCP